MWLLSIIANPLQHSRQGIHALDGAGQHRLGGLAGLVDDQQLIINRGAVLGVVRPVRADVRWTSIFLFENTPPSSESRLAVCHALALDGYQTAYWQHALQCLLDVLGADLRVTGAFYAVGAGRERRVQPDRDRPAVVRQDIVQLFRVLAG
ncbi:hypothetical protein H3H36_24470 [Duganella sp. FT3S]|uniref:Uncharacterized protein n=1 Tax=Rugamonas fusca TaxID=2758568 RepID=A0A7W2EM99_9BURK|nr:hypothetical protein [Rugamonas fusca]MBA5608506.1 hypothetical protein [Rugamonas fusca]